MTQPQPEKSYHDLVREIRNKDRRFRFFQGLFIAVVLAGFVALSVLGIQQLNALNNQAKIRTKNLQALIEDNQRQTQYIKCIARFFNERNRANANLTSLDDCTIQRADGSISPPDNVPPDTQPVSSTSTLQVLQAPAPGTVTVVPPTEPTPIINVPTPVTPVTPTPTPVPDPFKVLGIPACVPFTNVCIRH